VLYCVRNDAKRCCQQPAEPVEFLPQFLQPTSHYSLTSYLLQLRQHQAQVNLWPTVCLGVRRPSGTSDQFFFLLEISFRQLRVYYFVVPSLMRGRVCNLLYKCFWALPEQSLLGQSSTELMAIFYCLIWDSLNLEDQAPIFISPRNRVAQLYPWALGSLFVASYDSQGYGGGILTRLNSVRVTVTLQLTVSQSVCLGVEPNLGLLTRDLTCFLFLFLKVTVLSFGGALSDKRSGLSFVRLRLNWKYLFLLHILMLTQERP
jgi:hypothetical protein